MKFKVILIMVFASLSVTIKAQVNVYTRQQFKEKHGEMSKFEKQFANKIEDVTEKRILETARLNRKFQYICEKNGYDLSKLSVKNYLEIDIFLDTQASITEIVYGLSGLETEVNGERTTFKTIEKEVPEDIKDITKKCVDEFAGVLKIRFNQPGKERYKITLRGLTGRNKCNSIKKLCTVAALTINTRPDTVKYIDLSFSNLLKVPEELFRFTNLKELDLSNNMIKVAPKELWEFKILEKLNLSNNHFDNSDFNFRRNKKLSSLNIQFNLISQFPRKIHKLKGLNDLVMGNNDLTNFSKQRTRSIKNLKSLNLYNAYLVAVPKRLFRCKNLVELDLYHNNLKSLPDTYKKFKKLSSIALSYNDLWQMPDFSQYPSLTKLYVHHNKIDKIANPLPTSMKLLDIGFNDFKLLPSNLAMMKNLETLDISNNEIEKFDAEILSLPKLSEFHCKNNLFNENEDFLAVYEKWKKSKGL